MYRAIILALLLLPALGAGTRCDSCARTPDGRVQRRASARREFQREQLCPPMGRTTGACPGYIVDHTTALALRRRARKIVSSAASVACSWNSRRRSGHIGPKTPLVRCSGSIRAELTQLCLWLSPRPCFALPALARAFTFRALSTGGWLYEPRDMRGLLCPPRPRDP
jgi:hypothetical protein